MIAILFGIIAAQWQAALPAWGWLAALSPLSVLSIYFLRRHPVYRLPPLLLLGYLWASGHALLLSTSALPLELQGRDLVVEGQVVGLPESGPRRQRFLFDVETMQLNGAAIAPPGRLRLAWYESGSPVATGERWRLTVRLKRPHGMANPHTFDYEAWLLQQRIRAVGYVRAGAENRRLGEGFAPLSRLRAGLRQRLDGSLGERPLAALIPALTIGDRSAMTHEQWQVLIGTGTNHLVAISGLHVGLVAGWVFFLMRWAWGRCTVCLRGLPAPQAGALAALLAALGYAALAGFSIPTQRALIMLSVLMLALLLRRSPSPTHTLSLALGAVLLHDPLAVLAAGFWLSFAAVAILLYGMGGRLFAAEAQADPDIEETGRRPFALRRLWWKWGRAQWLLAIGLTPLLLSLFQQAPLASPLANLIAVPWMSLLVVPLALLGSLLLPLIPPLGEALLWLAVGAAEELWPLLERLAAWAPPLHLAEPPLWMLAPALIGTAWMLAPRGWPNRWAGALLLLPMLLYRPAAPAHGEAWLSMLDVGQGLAVVVRTHRHLLLFDTGPRYGSGFDTGRAVIVPWLRGEGIGRIDALVVSHGDNDHIGGVRSILAAMPVARVYTGVPEKLSWTEHTPCEQGQSWSWDGVRFSFIHPQGRWRGNDGSCVLRVDAVNGAMLLPGDIEEPAERALLASGVELDVDILIAPHHGSKSSSSADFIKATSPDWVLFPVGYRNRYGHPHPQVVARYREQGSALVDSVCGGALTLMPGQQGGWHLQAWREQRRRYWHAAPCALSD